jgi:two-component system sensor histidine kinase ChvG
MRAVCELANQVKREDGVSFILDIARDEDKGDPLRCIVSGHDSRLGQVITNLLDNARSFSQPGSSVRVALRPAREPGRSGGPEGFEIIVDDDGPGIPAHAFERIFERFYTDRPEQGFGQNSGLGLSISRQIIEAHGGKIWAVNRLDNATGNVVGARFFVWLPTP